MLKLKDKFSVAVIGPESTGKSILCEQLALHYQCEFVPEMARFYLNSLNRKYNYEDLLEIAKLQFNEEQKQCNEQGDICICDTNLTVIKIWSEFVFGKCDSWILNKDAETHYDLILLCDIDLPWQEDPLREHPNKRKELFSIYYRTLIRKNDPFKIVRGVGKERVASAIAHIEYFKTKNK